jgi:hypothetical protein
MWLLLQPFGLGLFRWRANSTAVTEIVERSSRKSWKGGSKLAWPVQNGSRPVCLAPSSMARLAKKRPQ